MTLQIGLNPVEHYLSPSSFALPRVNYANHSETFGPEEHNTEIRGRRPFTPGYPTNWAYGGDHAVGGTPSMESRFDSAVLNPLNENGSWFLYSSRASISPGKVLHGALLRSFMEANIGDLSTSDVGYPGIMTRFICRTMYFRQTENASERSRFFYLGVYDRTSAENHGVELEWSTTNLGDAPVLSVVKKLDTYLSSWRVITDDPFAEPIVGNGWHRIEIVYESVPIHSESWISPWSAIADYSAGDWIYPLTSPNLEISYQCIASGTSGATEPSWPTSDSATISDGSATWKTHTPNDSNHVTNRGRTQITSSSEDTPVNMRGRGHYLFGDQYELDKTTSSDYQRVRLQYYNPVLSVHPSSVSPTYTLLP